MNAQNPLIQPLCCWFLAIVNFYRKLFVACSYTISLWDLIKNILTPKHSSSLLPKKRHSQILISLLTVLPYTDIDATHYHLVSDGFNNALRATLHQFIDNRLVPIEFFSNNFWKIKEKSTLYKKILINNRVSVSIIWEVT